MSTQLEHGKEWTYQKDGCRCPACRAASQRAQMTRRQRAKHKFATEGPDGFTHGTRWTYDAGCRCQECVDERNRYARHWYRARRIRDEVGAPSITGDLTARRNDPPPALSTPRARPVYGCDCGATFTDRRDIARHECAA